MVVDQRHVVRLVNDELLNLFNLKQSPLGRTVLESLREARVEMIVRETLLRGEPRQQEVTLESAALGLAPRHFDISAVPIRTQKGGGARGGGRLPRHHPDQAVGGGAAGVRGQCFPRTAHAAGHFSRLPGDARGQSRTCRREESQRILETMKRHSNRLNALVEDLLILTRIGSAAGRGRIQPDPRRRLFPPVGAGLGETGRIPARWTSNSKCRRISRRWTSMRCASSR
jgi:two-component system phosphate regulon sensor histidine kinase PhoR